MANRMEAVPTTGENVSWHLVNQLEEQRLHPRVVLDIPVAFRNAQGQHCAAKLCNISSDGLQVHCNVVTAQIIHPAGGRLADCNQPILQATLAVPVGTGFEPLSLGVRLQYLTVGAGEARCVLGFSFLNLRPKARRIVAGFLAGRLSEFYSHDSVSHVA